MQKNHGGGKVADYHMTGGHVADYHLCGGSRTGGRVKSGDRQRKFCGGLARRTTFFQLRRTGGVRHLKLGGAPTSVIYPKKQEF